MGMANGITATNRVRSLGGRFLWMTSPAANDYLDLASGDDEDSQQSISITINRRLADVCSKMEQPPLKSGVEP